jgi:hypothetical protein
MRDGNVIFGGSSEQLYQSSSSSSPIPADNSLEQAPELTPEKQTFSKFARKEEYVIDVNVDTASESEIAELIFNYLKAENIDSSIKHGLYANVYLADLRSLDSRAAIKMVGGDYFKQGYSFMCSPCLEVDLTNLDKTLRGDLELLPRIYASFRNEQGELIALVIEEIETKGNSIKELRSLGNFDISKAQTELFKLVDYFISKGLVIIDPNDYNIIRIAEGKWLLIDAGALRNIDEVESTKFFDPSHAVGIFLREKFTPPYTLADLIDTQFFDHDHIKLGLFKLINQFLEQGLTLGDLNPNNLIQISPDEWMLTDRRTLRPISEAQDTRLLDPDYIIQNLLKDL